MQNFLTIIFLGAGGIATIIACCDAPFIVRFLIEQLRRSLS
jgi:hypothetical protein